VNIRLVNYRFLLCAVVIWGLLAGLTFNGSETQAFDLKGVGNLAALGSIQTDCGPIPDVAQEQAERPTLPATKTPTLGCCKCLGGTNTVDLSTIISNPWIVKDPNGVSAPVVFLTLIHPLWNISTGSASWVSTVATGGTGNVTPGTYDYKLVFVVPCCVIEQRVTLSGTYGGDDLIGVYLDNTTNLISKCAGTVGYCFNTSNAPPPINNYVVPCGTHTLIVRVYNSGGPSGMFINAKLTGKCRS